MLLVSNTGFARANYFNGSILPPLISDDVKIITLNGCPIIHKHVMAIFMTQAWITDSTYRISSRISDF